jgi:hypothetical protein
MREEVYVLRASGGEDDNAGENNVGSRREVLSNGSIGQTIPKLVQFGIILLRTYGAHVGIHLYIETSLG